MLSKTNPLKLTRILFGKLTVRRHKSPPWHGPKIFRYWDGRLIYLSFGKLSINLDCRKNFLKDMAHGSVE